MSQRLRDWQASCIERLLERYQKQRDCLVVATPGAGKTTMAAVLCQRLFLGNHIDLVLCITPSVAVARSFAGALQLHTGRNMSGGLGAHGQVVTYQSLSSLPVHFWEAIEHHRVFVILDEIHHCAGQSLQDANRWGDALLTKVCTSAAFTLSLSGTPWRSDSLPVTLAAYNPDQKLIADYTYPLARAIAEQVCRRPNLLLIDNANLSCHNREGKVSHYNTIEDLLGNECLPFQLLLENPSLSKEILKRSVQKLREVQKQNPNAGGLIVATSIAHALTLKERMFALCGIDAWVVSHTTPDAQLVMERFRQGHGEWLISVGMVSEGTDIPRLQVCAYLTRIKTELYFRQVLGRIMRNDGSPLQDCYFFALAEPTLKSFAHRLSEDIPEMPVRIEQTADDILLCDTPSFSHQEMDIWPITSHHSSSDRESIDNDGPFTSPRSPVSALFPIELNVSDNYLEHLIHWENQFHTAAI